MSNYDKFKKLCDQYTTGLINCDESMCQSSQMLSEIEDLEQRIADMPRLYYKQSFITSEQALVIYEMSSETMVLRWNTQIALRISGLLDSTEVHLHQGVAVSLTTKGLHIVVDDDDYVRAVYKV